MIAKEYEFAIVQLCFKLCYSVIMKHTSVISTCSSVWI